MDKPMLIFDDACPMCKLYTGAFTRLKWTDRIGFSESPAALRRCLDLDRARHEIPLYDPHTGEVRYGLRALFEVLGTRLPWLRPVFAHPLTYHVLRPLYQLITYNRRIIAGTRAPATGFDCAPDFHLGWRLAYIFLALTATLVIAGAYPPAIFGCCIWYLLGAALAVTTKKRQARVGGAGHWATIGLIAVLPLLTHGWIGDASYLLGAALGAWAIIKRWRLPV